MTENTIISIVVLTYNNSDTIFRCLKSVLNQDCPSNYYKVIIIDNGSTDSTLDIVRNFGCKYYSFPDLTIAQLRNKGVELAESQFVAFIDSDCEISSDWILSAIKHFGNEKVAIVGYKYQLPPNASFLERNWIGIPQDEVNENALIPAGNMAVSKRIFNLIGGFDDTLITGEDTYLLELAKARGFKTISDPSLKSVHYGNPKTILQLYIREVWYGIGNKDILGRIRGFDKPFILANIVLISFFIFIYGIITLNIGMLLIFFGVLFSLSLFSSVDRRIFKRINGNFMFMVFCYHFYLLARAHSLLYIYGIKRYKKK